MKTVSSIARDMVARRLWPVAVLLVAALAAIPVFLGGGGQAAPPRPAASADAAAGGTTAQVSLDTSVPVRRERGGPVRNPFKRPTVARPRRKAPIGGGTPAPAVSVPAPAAGPSLDLPGGLGGGAATPVPAPRPSVGRRPGASDPKPKPKPKPAATYHVTLRFGQTGKLATLRDIARLSPLPSVADPFFVFLGVLEDGKTAVFMVSSDAVPTGDGTCRPNDLTCDTIELKAGDTEWFDFTAPDGSVTQYQMDLVRVRKAKTQAIARAARVYARHSAAGDRKSVV
jgi:hypothetical protein